MEQTRIWPVTAIAISLAAFLLAVTAFVVNVAVAANGSPGGGSRPVGGGGAAAPAAPTGPIEVELSEWGVEVATAEVGAGNVRFEVTNAGAIPHTLGIEGMDVETPHLNGGESAVLDAGDLAPGTYKLVCTIPGHVAAGMETEFTVVAAGNAVAPAPEGDGHEGHDHSMDFEEMDRIMRERTLAFPAETEGVGAQDLAPTVLADGTKEWTLTTSIVEWEREPGDFVEAWTYNGTVPGPTLRADVGDNVRVVLKNELPESTAIHFHGIKTPNAMDGVPDITQDPVKPGETFVYEFTVTEPQVGMYHSHHHADVQIPNGLAGTFLVGDLPLPEGVEISQEIPMVLNDAGTIGLSLNGKSFPATAPIVANQGEYLLVHYLNEGLQIHPMHLHGVNQWVIAKDGFPLPEPQRVDTVNVAPGERWSVLVEADLPGVWAWHCHILTHAERHDGMFGMVTAMIVNQ